MKKIYCYSLMFMLGCLSLSGQSKIDNLSLNYGEEIKDDKGKIIKIVGESIAKTKSSH